MQATEAAPYSLNVQVGFMVVIRQWDRNYQAACDKNTLLYYQVTDGKLRLRGLAE